MSPDRSPGDLSAGTGSVGGASGSGLDHSGGYGQTSPRSVLGPDGRRAEENWNEFSGGVSAMIERNPTIAALTALGVGLAVGMIVGAAIARD